MLKPLVLLSLVLASLAHASAPEGPTVTLPLDQYLEMKKQLDTPSATTIEELRVTGDMKNPSTLTMIISGASSGRMPAIDVLEQSDGYSLFSCNGAAMLQAHDGMLALIPQKNRFVLECKISPKVQAEIPVTVLNALFVKNAVAGAELVMKTESGEKKQFVLARIDASRGLASGPVTSTAYYRIAALPDDNRFEYRFTFYNPNRTSQNFELALRNGESVQEIHTTIVYEEKGQAIKLKLVPGESTITLNGKLQADKFLPLTESSQQYLLLENHPLLQVSTESKARRVSIEESGMAPKYPGALAFLLDSGTRFAWKTRKLQVFESQGYTIEHANYSYYVPNHGEGIVEAHFMVENRGAPELSLDVPGKAAYLEIDGIPQALYKDEAGKLLVHLPSGRHGLVVQYRPSEGARGLASGISDHLLKPNGVISDLSVTVMLAEGWSLLFGRAISDIQTALSMRIALLGLLMFALYLVLFRAIALTGRDQVFGALGVAALSLVNMWVFGVALVVWAALLLIHHRGPLFGWFGATWFRTISGICVALLAMFSAVLVLNPTQSESLQRMKSAGGVAANEMMMADSMMQGMGGAGKAKAQMFANNAKAPVAAAPRVMRDESEGAAGVGGGEVFQGIPARIKIPAARTWISFRQSLIEAGEPINLRVNVVSQRLVMALVAMMGLMTLGVSITNRQKIAQYLVA